MLVSRHLLVFLALACDALASRDSQTESVCSTLVGPNVMRRVPTYWGPEVTKTVTKTKCSIKILRSTVTPKKETATVRTTKLSTTTVTAEPAVKTATTTVTETGSTLITNSHIDVSTSTVFETSTSTSTPIVPTPEGFTAIKDYGGWVPKVRREDEDEDLDMDLSAEWRDEDEGEEEEFHVLEARGDSDKLRCKIGPKGPESYPKQYPNRVDCIRTRWQTEYKTTTKTVTGKPTTIRPVTTTVTRTITDVITDTAYPPDVTNTVTEFTSTILTEFADVTVTTTEKTTSTIVEIIPTNTFYAACGANNVINTANGGGYIGGLSYSAENCTTYAEDIYGVEDGYACCVLCQTSEKPCRASWYADGTQWDYPEEFKHSCTLVLNDQICTGDFRFQMEYHTSRHPDVAPGYFISNGPIGVFENGGDGTRTV